MYRFSQEFSCFLIWNGFNIESVWVKRCYLSTFSMHLNVTLWKEKKWSSWTNLHIYWCFQFSWLTTYWYESPMLAFACDIYQHRIEIWLSPYQLPIFDFKNNIWFSFPVSISEPFDMELLNRVIEDVSIFTQPKTIDQFEIWARICITSVASFYFLANADWSSYLLQPFTLSEQNRLESVHFVSQKIIDSEYQEIYSNGIFSSILTCNKIFLTQFFSKLPFSSNCKPNCIEIIYNYNLYPHWN